MSDVAARIRKLVVKHLGVEDERLTDDASFVDDLGADSLEAVELVMAVEDEFDCTIPDEAVEKLETVQGVVSFVESIQQGGPLDKSSPPRLATPQA